MTDRIPLTVRERERGARDDENKRSGALSSETSTAAAFIHSIANIIHSTHAKRHQNLIFM